MNAQRPQHSNPVSPNPIIDHWLLGTQALYPLARQHAHPVRRGQDTQRTIFGTRVIEIEARRYDARGRVGYSVPVDYSVLYAPRSQLRDFMALASRQSRVLVPNYEPVRDRRLVEQCGTRWKWIAAENPAGDGLESWVVGHELDGGMFECVTHSGPASR